MHYTAMPYRSDSTDRDVMEVNRGTFNSPRFGKVNVPSLPETGLEPALPVKATRPSTWRVCQFRHSGALVFLHIMKRGRRKARAFRRRTCEDIYRPAGARL